MRRAIGIVLGLVIASGIAWGDDGTSLSTAEIEARIYRFCVERNAKGPDEAISDCVVEQKGSVFVLGTIREVNKPGTIGDDAVMACTEKVTPDDRIVEWTDMSAVLRCYVFVAGEVLWKVGQEKK